MAKLRVNPFSLFTPIRLVGFNRSTYNHEFMINHSPTKINRSNDRPKVLIWGLLLSLLLHILVVLFFVFFPQQQDLSLKRPPTTVVRLIDLKEKPKKPQPDKKSEFEIDQKPVETPPTTPVESFRKAEQDQKVEQEQAPEADDTRDQTTKRPVTNLPQQQRPQPELQPAPPEIRPEQPQEKTPAEKEKTEQSDKPVKSIRKAKTEPTVEQDKVKKKTQPSEMKPAPPPLSMEQLLPSPNTLDRITRGTQADRDRRKKREGVEIGDEVWLTTQQSMLTSFFRRLSDKIDLVWTYPRQAANQRIQGTVGLTIVINKKGELLDVLLDRSSGSDILDSEAIQAIYRAAPFGPITKRYPHEVLKIHANFRYQIGGRSIFGR